MGLFTRAIRPPDPETPNSNDPASVPPATVGPPNARPGDPHGVTVAATEPAFSPPPPVIRPSAWSGWPAEWATPNWGGQVQTLTDTAWACLDINSGALSTMPPYLVDAAPSLSADWIVNPHPDVYVSWAEMAKRMWWDYQAVGECFIHADAYYATGWPSRFHVVPPWSVNVEMRNGLRHYTIGDLDVTGRMLHIRYLSSVDDAHGHGPLEAGAARLVAAQVLQRYASTVVTSGLIPSSILEAPEDLPAAQAALLRDQWVQQRTENPGLPAVLSGGLKWTPTQLDPERMALLELSQFNEGRIAVLLGVPPHLVGLPTGGDSMTYARAQTAQILNAIVDPATGQPALTVQEIRRAERLDNSSPTDLAEGVLR
jgi:HK97 family phage portal protein